MKRALLLLLVSVSVFGQGRIASDFEIAQMREQIARSRSFASHISARLNLGDLYATRNDRTTAIREYRTALDVATKQREDARRDSDLTRYGTATSLAALAHAKLGDGSSAVEMAEEAVRYASDSADFWNVYASAMTVLGKPAKAVAAARNAVHIAEADLAREATVPRRLDVAVFRYSLASALLDAADAAGGERLMQEVISSLRSREFDAVRREVARSESFEINSTTQGDAAAYLSLLNRAQLRLASSLERRGELAAARAQYENVLESRTDDAIALAALARLSREERYFAAAFDANPFSMPLVREYQRHLAARAVDDIEANTTGGRVRRALVHMHRGEMRAARAEIAALLEQFPANETLKTLRGETDTAAQVPSFLATGGTPRGGELRSLLALLRDDKLTPEQRVALDRATLQSVVTFDAATVSGSQTVLERGTADGVAFRFSEPTIFAGAFAANTPLRLTYRVLGATGDALLLEPLRLEAAP